MTCIFKQYKQLYSSIIFGGFVLSSIQPIILFAPEQTVVNKQPASIFVTDIPQEVYDSLLLIKNNLYTRHDALLGSLLDGNQNQLPFIVFFYVLKNACDTVINHDNS